MSHHYLVICAIFRDESGYLAEWINFHRLVGVEHFYLYDNFSQDNFRIVLEPFIKKGWVTLKSWPVPFHQNAARRAYADCLDSIRGRVRWLACIDIDEFLFSPQHDKVTTMLKQYELYPGVVVRWQVYGSSGRQLESSEPVISRFTQRAKVNWIRNRRVKSIVDPERTIKPLGCHHFEYKNGGDAVDESKQPVKTKPAFRFKKQLKFCYRMLGPAIKYVDPYASKDIDNKIILVNHLRINHYPIKSRQEFLKKSQFKKEKSRYKIIDYFAYHDRNDITDPILHRYLADLNKVSKY